ncbi:MAG: enoyl-CoA hydratase/isomerase family protein [Gemmatimonadales bacterium]
MTPASEITARFVGDVAIVRLDRGERLNAFTPAMFALLERMLDDLAIRPGLAGVVLTGTGRGCCAGEDLESMEALAEVGIGRARRELERVQGLTRRLLALPVPVVAAINGVAAGLGAELPLGCSIRVAVPDAYFVFPEARRGLVETNATFHLLPRIVGSAVAAEWLLTARRIPAVEALRRGLVSELVPADRLVERAIALGAGHRVLPAHP